ncbi:Cysteine protease Prp [uncultured Caudovirales phage]|uniref:Cysteine protease Prp n=1 Tax=uncultured Caudovirales phage TaxID=2100421 RepID=A0A6J5LQL6_9CAUD|nr:Cysteine protease Prp [uncultured Caudovirales phage]
MISVEVVEGDGTWQLKITGHADESVCAAITAMEQSTAIWLEQLAELVPAALTFTYRQEATP